MKIRKYIVFIFLIYIFSSCEKVVNIEIPASKENFLIIEGILYAGKKPNIYISNSQSFFSSDVTPQEVFARGAQVAIYDGSSTFELFADSVFDKSRCRWVLFYTADFLPQHGKTYTLNVLYNNKSYTAQTTIDQRVPEIISIEYTPEFYDVYGGHDGVIININDPEGIGDFYRFQMNRMIDTSRNHAHVLDIFENTCAEPGELFYVKDIGRVVFSDTNSDGGTLEMMIEVSYEYYEGDEGYIMIQSLDENAANFYTNLDEQLQAILNPFVEPVFINSQIEGAIGVFGSAVLTDSVLFVYPQDFP
jgi:hypothetical protein